MTTEARQASRRHYLYFSISCRSSGLLSSELSLPGKSVVSSKGSKWVLHTLCHRVPCSLHTTELLYYPMNKKHKFPFFFLINRPLTHLFFEFAPTQTQKCSLYIEQKWRHKPSNSCATRTFHATPSELHVHSIGAAQIT